MPTQKPKTKIRNRPKVRAYELKPFATKKINIVCSAVVLAFFLAASGLFIYPAFDRSGELRAQLVRQEAEIQQKLKLTEGLEDLIERYRDDLRLAEALVFTDRDLATFLENFSDLARKANVTILRIKSLKMKPVPLPSEPEEALRRLNKKKGKSNNQEEDLPGLLMQPMDIRIMGEYSALINFLISLEEYKQLLTIDNLKISVARDGYPNLEADFIMRLYTMGSARQRTKMRGGLR